MREQPEGGKTKYHASQGIDKVLARYLRQSIERGIVLADKVSR